MQNSSIANRHVVYFLFFVVLVCPLSGLADTDEFAEDLLGETVVMADKLPPSSQCDILAQVAAEYMRFGHDAKAEPLWDQIGDLIQSCDDKDLRDEMLTSFAVQKTRSGDFERAEVLLLKIENVKVRHQTIQRMAQVLCDQAKFKDALEFADSIPRGSPILFDTMEMIGLAAAASGEIVLAARASRGMNPGMGGSMARKLRTVSKMCQSYWKTGNKESAIPFMWQGKQFSDIMKLDLESTLIINTTWSALQAEDFEVEVTKTLDELNKADGEIDKVEIRISLAYVVLSFDRVDLVKHFRGANDGDSYRELLDILVANHLAESGKTNEALKAIETIRVPLFAADAYVKLAQFQFDNDRSDEAQKYLNLAKPIILDFVDKEDIPVNFWWVLLDYVSLSASTGHHAEALALVKQLVDPVKVAEHLVQIAQAMPSSAE